MPSFTMYSTPSVGAGGGWLIFALPPAPVARLARVAARAKPISPHSVTYSFVTAALDAGASLRDVHYAAGHPDPRTTRRYDRTRYSLGRHPTYAPASGCRMNGEVLCPRCERNYLQPAEEGPGQTLSRMTRDDGAQVYICLDCGIREAMRERVGLAPIPLEDWPRSAAELAMEDELRD